jgi:hypothetical protein
MIYIQLFEPIKGYNKAKITKINFFENAQFGADDSIAFNYITYRDNQSGVEVLYDKFVDINNKDFIDSFKTISHPSLSSFDGVSRILLQYLIDNGYETGTLEVQ